MTGERSESDDQPNVDTQAPSAPTGFARYAETLVAVGVEAMGIVILLETRDIRVPRAFSSVGPRVVPYIIGWGLVIIGAWYAIDVVRGRPAAPSADSEDADPTLPADWAVLGGLALALAVYAVLMEPAGFVLASALLFTMATFAMGSRLIVRDAGIGLAVSVITFLVFSEWLGIRLPPGLLEPVFG